MYNSRNKKETLVRQGLESIFFTECVSPWPWKKVLEEDKELLEGKEEAALEVEEENTELKQRITKRTQADTKTPQTVSVAPGGQGEPEEDGKKQNYVREKCQASQTLPRS